MRNRKTMNALLIERAITNIGLIPGEELISNKELKTRLRLDVPLISLGIVMKKLGFQGITTPEGTFYLVSSLGE